MNKTFYGLWDTLGEFWFHEEHDQRKPILFFEIEQVARATCLGLNKRWETQDRSNVADRWDVKIIGDNGLAIDLLEC